MVMEMLVHCTQHIPKQPWCTMDPCVMGPQVATEHSTTVRPGTRESLGIEWKKAWSKG